MPKPSLRAVSEDERPESKPKTLKDAADVSERALLLTMRDEISTEIDNGVPPHTLAPLLRQLRELDKEIRALDLRELEESGRGGDVDERFDASAI